MIQRLRSPTFRTEQQLQPLRTTPQHIAERRTAPTQQPQLHSPERIPLPQRLQQRPRLRHRTTHRLRLRNHYPSVRRPLQKPPRLQQPEQPVQQPLVLHNHLQRSTQLRRTHHRTRLPTPPQPLQRLQRIPPRKPLQVGDEVRRSLGLDPLRAKMHSKIPHPARNRARRDQELRRTQPPRQRPLMPHHVVEQPLHPRHRREQRRARRTLQREPLNTPNALSVHPVQPKLHPPDIRRRPPISFSAPDMTQHPTRQPTRQPQPVPTERQPRLLGAGPARRRQRLETPVEHHHGSRRITGLLPRRQRHLRQRLVLSRPHRLHHPEPWTVAKPRLRQTLVERRQGHRRQLRLQPLDIEDRTAPVFSRPRTHTTLGMTYPGLLPRTAAVHLHQTRPLRLRRTHHHLQRPHTTLVWKLPCRLGSRGFPPSRG